MKTIKSILISVLLLSAVSVSAQNIESFKGRLAVPSGENGARVVVVERGGAGEVVKLLEAANQVDKINGYRIRIFLDNSQNAHSAAAGTQAAFKELFPTIPAYMSYESPYFKVTIGNCLTVEEAVMLWGRVKNSFDKAFVVREKIPLNAIIEE